LPRHENKKLPMPREVPGNRKLKITHIKYYQPGKIAEVLNLLVVTITQWLSL